MSSSRMCHACLRLIQPKEKSWYDEFSDTYTCEQCLPKPRKLSNDDHAAWRQYAAAALTGMLKSFNQGCREHARQAAACADSLMNEDMARFSSGNLKAATTDGLRAELGPKPPKPAKWECDREIVLDWLRQICGVLGDNDWPDSLDIRDILQKHVLRNLENYKLRNVEMAWPGQRILYRHQDVMRLVRVANSYSDGRMSFDYEEFLEALKPFEGIK